MPVGSGDGSRGGSGGGAEHRVGREGGLEALSSSWRASVMRGSIPMWCRVVGCSQARLGILFLFRSGQADFVFWLGDNVGSLDIVSARINGLEWHMAFFFKGGFLGPRLKQILHVHFQEQSEVRAGPPWLGKDVSQERGSNGGLGSPSS